MDGLPPLAILMWYMLLALFVNNDETRAWSINVTPHGAVVRVYNLMCSKESFKRQWFHLKNGFSHWHTKLLGPYMCIGSILEEGVIPQKKFGGV
jgi:hypothetical protein